MTTAALLLASASVVWAQTPAPAGNATTPATGMIDIGLRAGSTSGDEARFERYRDLKDGAYSRIVFGKETDDYVFAAAAANVGYRDQQYSASFTNAKVKFTGYWDSTPLNYSYDTLTPWVESGAGAWTLDRAARTAVQGRQPGVLGIPTNAAALASVSIYRGLAQGFDMESRRDSAGFGLAFQPTQDVGVNVAFATAKKTGYQPWGGAFAFSNANELPLPLDHRTNDLSVGVEWASRKGMIRLGWDGSWFDNQIQTLVWDNPIRATDFANANLPPNGPWDNSGYSNGNGPAQGRMSLAPSNTMNVVSVMGLYKLPMRSSINGTLQFMNQDQDEALIPWTINSVINNAVSATVFPHLRDLPRDTAEAGVKGLNALVNFTSRPSRVFGIQARYRYNDRDVTTPEFDATEYVRFDAVPEEIEEGFSHQYDVTRQNFDVNGTLTLIGLGAIRAGYGHEAYERHGRGFSDVSENVFRASYDLVSMQYFSVRAGVDVGRRRGEGFIESGVDYEEGPGGTQPGLRYYDEADRNRTRGSVVLTVNPVDIASVYFSFAGGKDEYLADESVPAGREQFGLIDTDVKSWNIGASLNPTETVAIGANFGQEKYSAFQKSRNANPPPDASWVDPARNWTLDNDETVNNFGAYVDLVKAIRKTDVHIGYDFSDSDQAFVHGGPRITALSAINQFRALPNVTNTWQRLTADVKVFFTARVGVGLGYWYEKFEVEDFATINLPGTDSPRIDYLGGLTTGYANRPYEANTGFFRLIFMF
jgi:MtrB/PioB family decaheme-associated outer membrane protein